MLPTWLMRPRGWFEYQSCTTSTTHPLRTTLTVQQIPQQHYLVPITLCTTLAPTRTHLSQQPWGQVYPVWYDLYGPRTGLVAPNRWIEWTFKKHCDIHSTLHSTRIKHTQCPLTDADGRDNAEKIYSWVRKQTMWGHRVHLVEVLHCYIYECLYE